MLRYRLALLVFILLVFAPVWCFAATISQANWSLKYVDSQELAGEYAPATSAFDGSQASMWHTEWAKNSPPCPHEIQIDLGFSYNITGFGYLPRQDGGTNGRISQYEFYVSSDGTNWGSAVATGTFANTATEKDVTFTSKAGRYVRLRALSEVNGKAWTSAAEILVMGTPGSGNQPPICIMDKPSKDITIAAGEQASFLGTASDPDNNLPLSFLWHFGSNSGVSDATVVDPGLLTFGIPGNYSVGFSVTDSKGLICPAPKTRVVNVNTTPLTLLPHWSKINPAPFTLSVPASVTNPVLTAANVTDVTAQFVADPFLFHDDNGKWWLFFEVALATDTPGYIGVASSTDALHWTYEKTVLKEAFHLSYPFIFKNGGKYYLMPETNQISEIRLYETSNFPYEWHYSTTLVSGKRFVDPVIFWFNGTWWLFASDTGNQNLYLYYSDSLTSGWTQHPMSPVVVNTAMARPAGRPFVFNQDRIIRVGQKNDLFYGEQVRAFEIDVLSKTSYLEHEIPESPLLKGSGSGWNTTGMHQFDPWWTGSQWLCSADGNNNGIWSIGLYQLTDTVSPSAAITSPSGGTVGGTVAVAVTASDNVAVSKVELYVNGTLSDTSSTAPYSFNWNTTSLTNGSCNLSAKAYDASGNVGTSSTVRVTVNNEKTPPTTSITSPLNGATVKGSVTVAANASDNVGVTKVELYVNGALYAADTASPYQFTWDTTLLANGSVTLQTKAYDAANNLGQSATVTVTVNNDAIAPTASISSPLAGATVNGTVTVSATATDNIGVIKAELYVNGTLSATLTTAPYNFNWDSTLTANGSCPLAVKAYDAAGNVGTSGTVTVTLANDKTPPAVSIGSPLAGATVNGMATVSATATDNVGVTKTELYVNGTLYATLTAAPYNFSWDSTLAANGSCTLAAKAYDAAGNIATSSTVTVTVANDKTPPAVSISSPLAGATVSGTITVSATATDSVGVTRAELYVNGTLYAALTTAPYNFSWDSTPLGNGSCVLLAKAYDAAGNIGQSSTVTVNVQNGAVVLSRTGWKITYVDSQELVGENGAATNALDGDQATFWHTQWDGAEPPTPHELRIDLGAYYDLSGFRYLPRQDGSPNGRIGQYEFYASMDGVNWGTAAATGTFANSASEKEVTFTSRTARYARLRALTEANGKAWTSMAELNILGRVFSGNLPPDGAITSPSSSVTVSVGDTVQFSGAGTDPDANLPLSYRWNFGTGSGIADATVKDPGAVQFLAAGSYTVTFTVTDGLGAVDPTPASVVVTVLNPLPVIPRTGWKLLYVDSQETSGENAAATNAFDGNTATFWHTQWSAANPPCPHEIQIDLGTTRTVGGFRYLPRQDDGLNGTIAKYEFYLSSDGLTWGSAVATGTFAGTQAEKEVIFTSRSARYVRLRALTEINGNPWTSAAELNVLGQ
jgi:hypothetical protein